MDFWNDYEGALLAGTFPLEKLLRTEGRSATFATRDAQGGPATIRVTESLNDEEWMRVRYRTIQNLNQPGLLTIESFGATQFDGNPLTYVVLEPTDANLAEILRERPLSSDETLQVAVAVIDALQALHSAGMVHGQVSPESVVAVGEKVKLRSDCPRPVPHPDELPQAIASDTQAYADLLHRALTQAPLLDVSDTLTLQEPWAHILRQLLRGTWTLAEVSAELHRAARPHSAAPVTPVATPVVEEAAAPILRPTGGSTGVPVSTMAAAAQAAPPVPVIAAADAQASALNPPPRRARRVEDDAQLPLVYAEPAGAVESESSGEAGDEHTFAPRRRSAFDEEPAPADRNPLIWVAIVAGALVLILLVSHIWGSHASAPKPVATAPATTAAPANHAPATPATSLAPQHRPAATPAPQQANEPRPQPGKAWRVVAYTYNRRSEAESKARFIAEHHRDLRPQVFTRSGHAPFLVTLGGGPTTREAAEAIRQRARSEGLARDIYVQNYSH